MCKSKLVLLAIVVLILSPCCNPDKKDWDSIKHSDNLQLIEDYIENYPESIYLDSAALKLEELNWHTVKQSDSIQNIESFLSRFPEGEYYDSALFSLEKHIYFHSKNSISRSGTFEEYESFVESYPKIAELSDVQEKIEYLKVSSDTLIIYGRLIDSDKQAVSDNRVLFLPLKKKGQERYFSITIGEGGKISMPETNSDSNGEFCIQVHRSILSATKEFAVSNPGMDFLVDENKEPIFWTVDDNARIVELGDIIWK